MFEHFCMATEQSLQLLQRANGQCTEGGILSLVSTLPPNSGQLLLHELDQGMAERDLLWYSVQHGEEGHPLEPWPPLPLAERRNHTRRRGW